MPDHIFLADPHPIGENDTLISYFSKYKNMRIEGHISQVKEQEDFFRKLVVDEFSKYENVKAMEVGFNAGHSALIILESHPNVELTSFDIGEFKSAFIGSWFLKNKYPNRFKIVWGDSKTTIPEIPDSERYDFIFIDGGHDHLTAMKDLKNCKRLTHENTLVVMDDTIYFDGPRYSWEVAKKEGWIVEIGTKDFNHREIGGKGMSWGRYIL